MRGSLRRWMAVGLVAALVAGASSGVGARATDEGGEPAEDHSYSKQ